MRVLKNLMTPNVEQTTDDFLIDIKTGEAEDSESLNKHAKNINANARYAYRSYLTQLMASIIRWKMQPKKRVKKWVIQIETLRIELKILQEENPGLNNQFVANIWEKTFLDAIHLSSIEIGLKAIPIPFLTFEDVYETEFSILKY